jgi:Uma2 family endonuclease
VGSQAWGHLVSLEGRTRLADGLVFDRTLKLTLYAAAGIPEDWIIDVASGRAEVYRCPAAADDRDRPMVGCDGTIALLAMPDAAITAGLFA